MSPHNKGKSAVTDWLHAHKAYAGDDCLTWPFARKWNGYGNLVYAEKTRFAHRVMCLLAHDEPPTPKHVAAHSCHNGPKGCVNPRHLSWKTPRQNLLERRAAGTLTKKRWTNKGTLSPEQIQRIKSLKGKKNQREIGAMFGISYQHVSVVQNNRLKRDRVSE